MKRLACLLLAALLLCGCAAIKPAQTVPATEPVTEPATEPATQPPTEPATEPTEPDPVYYNPLNGKILEEPFNGRVYATTVSNIPDALPHVGVNQVDILMEMYVNGSIIRCLALFTEPENAATIGSVRSTRLMFNDIVQHYDAVLFHAGGDGSVLADAAARGIVNFNVDSWQLQNTTGISTRDQNRNRFIGWEHCLVLNGPAVKDFAEAQGVPVTADPEKDYGLLFWENAVPSDGEDAATVNIKFVYGRSNKGSVFQYLPELGKYHYGGVYYKTIMHNDELTKEPETFENVVVMIADITTRGPFHVADFVAGGTGYFASGGKIIPIRWTCDGENQPFRFYRLDGMPVIFSQGNSYIAVCHPDSVITWKGAEPQTATEG